VESIALHPLTGCKVTGTVVDSLGQFMVNGH